MEHLTLLLSLNACKDSIEFSSNYNTLKDAWNNCKRGDWMLWLAYELNVDIHILTLAKAYCARTIYHLLTDERSKDAIVVAINFGRNKATIEELEDAACAATYAVYATTNTNARATAAAVACAAANAYAAYAAAANAADAAADVATKTKNQLETANICRKYLTKIIFEKIDEWYN